MVRLPAEGSIKIFINCPYDDKYEPIFRAIIFTIIANGFTPVCAKEKSGADTRLDKILEMIQECIYGIHDISRTQIDKHTGLPRFNPPFELGLSIGCKAFGRGDQRTKDFLILDSKEYRFRESISDLSGSDPSSHNNNPEKVLQIVNNWLGQKRIKESRNQKDYIGSASIVGYYQEFLVDFPELCSQSNADINHLAHHELVLLTSNWLKNRKKIKYRKK